MDSLGVVESRTIASGVILADVMVKAAEVELLRAAPICSGRFLIYVAGDRAAVEAAVRDAVATGTRLAGSFLISNISPKVMHAIRGGKTPGEGAAIGVVESRTASSGIAAADVAVKRSVVELVRMVTGRGINGKSYFILQGDVASVTEAAEAAGQHLGKNLIDIAILPSPDGAVGRAICGIMR